MKIYYVLKTFEEDNPKLKNINSIQDTKQMSTQMKNFCQNCGNKLINQFCSHCKQTIFEDPKLAVAGIIVKNDQILLIKRGVQPQIGKWAFPSGYVIDMKLQKMHY